MGEEVEKPVGLQSYSRSTIALRLGDLRVNLIWQMHIYRIRLGKKAIAHAKSLKNNALVDWLKQDRAHCLLDDNPCKLPAYREMKAATSRYGSTMRCTRERQRDRARISPQKRPKNRSISGF